MGRKRSLRTISSYENISVRKQHRGTKNSKQVNLCEKVYAKDEK